MQKKEISVRHLQWETQLGHPYQELRLGPNWVFMVLPKLVEKGLIFTSKWTTSWHHGVRDALFNTHLQSFDSPITRNRIFPPIVHDALSLLFCTVPCPMYALC